jgi:hypothetical protein
VIAQGVVPRLLQLVGDNMMPTPIKVEATITFGSLAKGTEDHVKALVDLGVVPVLINGMFYVTYIIKFTPIFTYCAVVAG